MTDVRLLAPLLAVALSPACSPARAAEPTTSSCVRDDPRVGSRAFGFSLPGTDGKTVQFDGTDQVTLLVFWASWCKPCAEELPAYEAMMQRIGGRRAALTLVSTDENRETAADALRRFGVRTRSAYAGEAEFNRYLSPTLPWTIVVDSKQTIRAVHRGFNPACIDEIERSIVALTREQ